jgi:imidazolonepropionase-like amidohydrolase/ABC-type multidrug transport system permease subunit
MKTYLAHIRNNLRLMGRDRSVLFFALFFPMMFFVIFAFAYGAAKNPSAMAQVVSMVILIGVLGSGFFGAGIRAVQDRETGVLRRFKVAPSGPAPIIISSLVSGLASYLPTAALILVIAHVWFHMPYPAHLFELFLFVALGACAFRAIGMIIASVVNSAQEGNILIQLLYLPMLFLSGATFPPSFLPRWLQVVSEFLPATYLYQGIQSIMINGEGFWPNLTSALALLVAGAVAVFIGIKLFRWEKEEKISGKSKLWILVVLAPFLLLGIYQAKTRENLDKSKVILRTMSRGRARLFQNVRVFVGDGRVIPNGAVLVRNGKIAEVYDSPPADVKALEAEVVESSGKTLLPGLIDMHVHLGAPGGLYSNAADYAKPNATKRELAAYLFSGITAVRSVGDALDASLKLRGQIADGSYQGAELFVDGPMFTAAGGHGTEYGKYVPENMRASFNAQVSRTPKSAAEARTEVDALKAKGVDGIKAILEAGFSGMLFTRLETSIYSEIVKQAHADNLPVATHTGDSSDVKDAVDAGTNTIEHGSFRDVIPAALFDAMKQKGIAYDPTLSVIEAVREISQRKTDLLDRPLVQQVGPKALLDSTRAELMKSTEPKVPSDRLVEGYKRAEANLLSAYGAGVMLIAGSDAGNLLVIHGPTIEHELQLWVKAGIPPAVALRAATYNAAQALRAENRIGSIQKGREATFILVDGNPMEDINNMERITAVVFRGGWVERDQELFDQDKD